MSQAKRIHGAIVSTINETNFIGRSSGLATLCIISFLIASISPALSQDTKHEPKAPQFATLPSYHPTEVTASTFDVTLLPPLDSIDTKTDITVFLRSGVPTALQIAALRRAWKVDPMIRDFKGLQESDWDFNDPNGVRGFGELNPNTDTKTMVAQILGETPAVVAGDSSRRGFDMVVRFLRRLIIDPAVAHN
jgi:hypothetical protein